MKGALIALGLFIITTGAMSVPPDLFQAEKFDKGEKEEYTQVIEGKIDEWEKILDGMNEGRSPDERTQFTIDQLRPDLNLIENSLANIKSDSTDSWQLEQRRIQEGLARMQENFRQRTQAE